MIGFDVELNKHIIPHPCCPFCDFEMNYLGDVSEPADLRECQREHDPDVSLCFLNYSRFRCPKCGFDVRFHQQTLRTYITTEAPKRGLKPNTLTKKALKFER